MAEKQIPWICRRVEGSKVGRAPFFGLVRRAGHLAVLLLYRLIRKGPRWLTRPLAKAGDKNKLLASLRALAESDIEPPVKQTGHGAESGSNDVAHGKLRIALYAETNMNLIDGSVIWTASLVEALAGLGYVGIFLLLNCKEKRDLFTKPLRKLSNVTVIEIDGSDELVGDRLSRAGALDKIEALDRKLSFEAIIIRGFALCHEASLRSSFRGRLWAYVTDIPQNCEDLTPGILEKLDSIASFSRYLLCQTEELCSHWERNVPAALGRTRLLPPMIPTPTCVNETPQAVKRLCYAGKFAPLWGTLEMFEAFASLRAVRPDIELHVFGDKIHNPQELPDFQRRVRHHLENTAGVVWYRGLSREQVLAHLGRMDVGWAWRCPELENNTLELSTKLLEYGSRGLPVVLYRNAINEKLLGPDYPLFANTYDEVLGLIHRLLIAPDMLARASSKARAVSELFTIEHVSDKRIRPLLEYLTPETRSRRAKTRSIVVAGHSLAFIDGLCRKLPDNGYSVIIDKWERHNNHDRCQSERALKNADIVICEWCLGNAVWYSRKKKPGQRLIVRFHAQELRTDFPNQVDMHNVEKIVFVGPHIRRKAISRFRWEKWAEEKLVVIPNAVDTEAFGLPKLHETQFNIGIAGIVPQMKRFDLALDVIEKLRAEDRRFHLFVKGKLPHEYAWMLNRPEELRYYEGLMDRIHQSGLLKDAVHFDGWGDDMPEWYQKIGFVLSTSDFEAFHLSVAESAGSRAIPILLKWEGAEEIYPEDWSHQTVGSMSSALLNMVKSGDFEQIAAARHAYVEQHYRLERVLQSWLTLLKSECQDQLGPHY